MVNCFKLYTPFKERAYFLNIIIKKYELKKKSIFKYLYLGIETIFDSYYLKDDLLDSSDRYKNIFPSTNKDSLMLIADILSEIGHNFIHKYYYLSKSKSDCSFFFESFEKLCLGQLIWFKIAL
ncbi:MAG: hypothetical protein HC906_05605 [Bacteroidales bacterium]|nr:hypothetical protein [Bacteroidales bacterium]